MLLDRILFMKAKQKGVFFIYKELFFKHLRVDIKEAPENYSTPHSPSNKANSG